MESVDQGATILSLQLRKLFHSANEHRDFSIYARFMDAALEAKAQAMIPYFGEIDEGDVIVDAGSGTGKMAELVAQMFRGARVFGLDISHELQERAKEDKAITKLVFGDAAERNFPINSVKVKYFSTIGHEIESFGGPGKMKQAIINTLEELVPGGKIVIRDFAKPSIAAPIYMQIISDVGIKNAKEATASGVLDYSLLSTRALFEQFHEEFAGGNAFNYEIVTIDDTEYIRISPEWAHEFYLRKDYTANWRNEIKEKYTYWTQEQARQELEAAGYTDVQVIPDANDYILRNRLEGRIALFQIDPEGKLEPIPFPATHMVVVGTKPKSETDTDGRALIDTVAVNYERLVESVKYDENERTLTIGDKEFKTSADIPPLQTSKKTVYWLEGKPPRVIKTIRTDAMSQHAVFKSMYQTVEREKILDEYGVPYFPVIEKDAAGPPYRYVIQDAIAENAVSAVDLIVNGELDERDISQMASYISRFECSKKWQIDTNPYNWFRVILEDGTTQMKYADGKVYLYDEEWEFRRVGLLQWTDPRYVLEARIRSARIPTDKEYEEMVRRWKNTDDSLFKLWKKYLNPSIQPD